MLRLHRQELLLKTEGRGAREITRELDREVEASGIHTGLCTLFLHHTSAALVLCENADPDVRRDLETWLARAVPDGDPAFVHDAEGPDDMPAHVRTVLTASSLSLPVARGRLDLGTWQGVFLYEHRLAGHARRLTLTLLGS
jgi:secondary thiamine-phosphate synthase enzyme